MSSKYCKVCGDRLELWSSQITGVHKHCAGRRIADDKEPSHVDGTGIAITAVEMPTIQLSDHIKARLAHLEAIEAASRAVVLATVCADDLAAETTPRQIALHGVFDLIRKGMKDNGPL